MDEEEAEPTIGRNFKTKFEIPNEYSEGILITDSVFILSGRTSAICITADMRFKSRLEIDFKRVSERGVSIQAETGVGGNGCASPISFTSSREVLVLSGNEGQ